MAHLLVIGGASSDILHFVGESVSAPGGAGMYTAMAASRSGLKVSMFSPRPDPLPDQLLPVLQRLSSWFGPRIPPQELPQFEISYKHGRTEYLHSQLDAETNLSPGLLPGDLSIYDIVHVIPLGDVRKQLAFIQACKERGAKKISASTGLFNAVEQPHDVRAVFEACDYGFFNIEEAQTLYDSVEQITCLPGTVKFVTLGQNGALIFQGTLVTELPAVNCQVLDPTGAGDTFCGATLAQLIFGQHPIMAARKAMALASEMIEHPGPAALFWSQPAPDYPPDRRVIISNHQLNRIAQRIAELPEVIPFDFTGDGLPPVNHPIALDWFFASTLHQFGFWSTRNGKYHLPLISSIDGQERKGSDYLWQAYMKPIHTDPEFFSPRRQAAQTIEDIRELYRSDDGTDPMPAIELHLDLARQYGQDMLALDLTPYKIISTASESRTPLKTFFSILDHIGGYKEDPLRKKSGLLAMILNQRPEMYLPLGKDEQIPPVIDYHVMRTCLRTGLIEIVDEDLERQVVKRQILVPAGEEGIRLAAYRAMEQVTRRSGKSMGAVDWFFFNARTRCPEMTEPMCELCQIDPICAHRKDLFQPVLRTTFY